MSSGGTTAKKAAKEEKSSQFPVGARLKAQRLKKGWERHDLAAWLRIRESYLVAFEEGDVDALPSGVYLKGFLRSYARALGLDADDIVQEFQAAVPVVRERKATLSLPQPIGGRSVPLGLWACFGLVFVVLSYLGLYHFVLQDDGLSQMATVAAHRDTATVAPGLSPEIAAVMPDAPAVAPPVTRDHAKVKALSIDGGTEREQGAAQALASGDVPEPPNSEKPATRAEVATPGHFDIVASRASWIKLVDARGREVCNRVLKAGDTCAADAASAPFRLSTGDAGGVALRFGEAETGPLGHDAQHIDGLTLTRDDIREGRAPDPVVMAQHVAGKALADSDAATKSPVSDGTDTKKPRIAQATVRKPVGKPPANGARTPQVVAAAKRPPVEPVISESDRLNDRQLGEIKANASQQPSY